MGSSARIEVVGLGQCCVDYLTTINEHPPEDAKMEFNQLLIQGGGPVATALVCLARLGRRTAVVGRVGGDAFGRLIRQGLEEEGVDTTFLETVQNKTSQFAFILANPRRGSRSIIWTRGSAGPVWPKKVPLALIRQAEVLHLDGLMAEASLTAARLAREAGRCVVLDAGTLRTHSLELARLVDHLIVSENFVRALAPEDSPEAAVFKLKDLGPEAAVVTLGAEGSIGLEDNNLIRQPAFEVAAIDTTAAGDAYHGAYIHALLKGWGLERRMRFASAVAAINCTALGGRTTLPDEKAAIEFLVARQREAAPMIRAVGSP